MLEYTRKQILKQLWEFRLKRKKKQRLSFIVSWYFSKNLFIIFQKKIEYDMTQSSYVLTYPKEIFEANVVPVVLTDDDGQYSRVTL